MEKNNSSRRIFLLIVICHLTIFVKGQSLAFRHLDANDGLATNTVAQAAFDKNGSLWLSTGEAINFFDGNNITQFHWKNSSIFPQSEVTYFSVDSYNRLWACYNRRLILIDDKRHPQIYELHDSLKDAYIPFCSEIKGLGIMAISDRGSFYTSDIKKKWQKLEWFDRLVNEQPISFVNRFDSSSFLFKIKDNLMLINFRTGKVLFNIFVDEPIEGCKLNDKEVLIAVKYTWKFYRISIPQQKIVKIYTNKFDEGGNIINGEVQKMELAANGKVYISTRFSGLVQFDPSSESYSVYRHDYHSANSISSDNLRFMATNPDGYLVVTSRAGVNITNVFQNSFTALEYFKEPGGNVIDEGVVNVVEDHKKRLWILTQTQLFTWTPGDNYINPLLRLKDISSPRENAISPGLMAVDKYGRVWIPYEGYGILIFNDQGKLFRKLSQDTKQKGLHIPDNTVRAVRRKQDGKMFVGTQHGLFVIDPVTFEIDSLTTKTLVDSMHVTRVVDILQDGNAIWVTTSPNGAVYHYNLETKAVKRYTVQEGLASRRNYMLTKDKWGNVYASSFDGVSVFSADKKLTIITERSGLADLRSENAIADDSGYVWMTNNTMLIRYHPVKKIFNYFNEQNGINKSGFLIGACLKTQSGKLVFGLNRGLVIVDPKMVKSQSQQVNFVIFKVNTDNTVDRCSASSPLQLHYSNAKITFTYLSSDLISGNRIFYRYKMDGIDTIWSSSTKNQQVTYNLRPGNYRFHMQASYNQANWIDFPDAVKLSVTAPFWQQWWFYVLIGLIAVGTTLGIYRSVQYSKKQKRKLEELNRLMNESRLMAIRAQMNPHFIFNSLNAIQECIVMQDFDTAYQYLSKFSKLLRQVLNNSEKNLIPLKDEIEVNELYLELESLRFKKSFTYTLHIDDKIDTETIKFPSLMLQPFIENAVWHGLMHKQGEKQLAISFALENNHLECIIEDNGVGRERSAEIKKNKLGSQYFESKGTRLSEQRLRLLNETGHSRATIDIQDMKNENGQATGTRVTIQLPLNY